MSVSTVSGRESLLGAAVAGLYLLAASGTAAWSVLGGFEPIAGVGALSLVAFGLGSSRRIRSRREPSTAELAVEKVAGLLALATGVGLLWPLWLAIREGVADTVGIATVATLSLLAIVAGVMLVLGYHPGTDSGAVA